MLAVFVCYSINTNRITSNHNNKSSANSTKEHTSSVKDPKNKEEVTCKKKSVGRFEKTCLTPSKEVDFNVSVNSEKSNIPKINMSLESRFTKDMTDNTYLYILAFTGIFAVIAAGISSYLHKKSLTRFFLEYRDLNITADTDEKRMKSEVEIEKIKAKN